MSIHSFSKQAYTAPIDLWLAYCTERGLTPEVLDPLQGSVLTIEEASKLVGMGVFGFKQIGALGAYVFQLAPNEYQARLLYDPDFQYIGKPTDEPRKLKPPKYFRPKNSANILFVPPHLSDWWNPDVRYNLLIVEGALNAVRLAAAGYHAVAITGVFNYHTGGKNTPIIPELVRLAQSKQAERITILFDSDTGDPDEKRDLWNGLHLFSQDLIKLRPDRRETIFHARPPSKPDGSKNGPDDYLNEKGVDEFNRLLREESQRYEDNPYLRLEHTYLDRFILDELSGMFYDCNTRQLVKAEHADKIMATGGLVDDILANRPVRTQYNTKRLLSAPGLRVARGQRYQPDRDDTYFKDETDTPRINKFHPDDVPKAIKGDVSIAYEMLNSICRDSPSAVQKILTVAARHAQFPAKPPKLAILLAGEQRAGKSNFARLIGRSLSNRYHDTRVNLNVDFTSNWRGFAAKEWPEFDPKMDAEWLKDLITGSSYEVFVKYGANYVEHNYTLNIFTCNGLQSKIQEDDARFVIGGYAKPDDRRLGLEFENWVNGPGPSYFRHHLLNDIDPSEYDTMSTFTEMRDAIIEASKSYRSTIKDMILEELEQEAPDLSCLPNPVLATLLEPHKINVLQFNKQYGQYFIKPRLEMVKIDGVVVRFRAFKDHEYWKNCATTEEYRKQYELAMKFMSDRLKQNKY